LTERLRCLVPFCRRTRAREGYSEWICAKHWPLVDRDLKRRYTRIKRLTRKAQRLGRQVALQAGNRVGWRIWEQCKAQAIERAMGA